MLHVDNSGKGNCMYYAYSISLMYFLRTKKAFLTRDDIFNKLKLEESEKTCLRGLLSSKKAHQEFTSNEILTIIEPILGRATRNLSAEQTIQEFLNSPQDTSLFSAAQYGLEFCFKNLFAAANEFEFAEFIEHEFTNPDYTEAEIYRVVSIKQAMMEFASLRLSSIMNEFNFCLAKIEQDLEAQGKQFSEKEFTSHKVNLLDSILRKEVVEFFLANDQKNLNLYKNHLQKEHVWASEETLFVLHRAIQGERLVRNTQGTVDTAYDTQIHLHIYHNGHTPFPQSGNPEMILNNQGSIHWTSYIPCSIFSSKTQPSQYSLFKNSTGYIKNTYPSELLLYVRPNKQTGPRVAEALRQMHQEGLEGRGQYTSEKCKNIAQRFLSFAKENNRHFNLIGVNHFIKDMDNLIKKETEESEEYLEYLESAPFF